MLSSGNKKGMDGRQTDRHTDIQRETIIPRHYCVSGYKKKKKNKIKSTDDKMHANYPACKELTIKKGID